MPERLRSALFLPASNARAIEKARGLPCDMVILDLEDAVKAEAKPVARVNAVAAGGFGERLFTLRINAGDSPWHAEDVAAARASSAALIVVPKVEEAGEAARVAEAVDRPIFCMIETPRGVLEAPAIAAAAGVEGLIAGPNDLRATLGIRDGRAGLALALQTIVLAARAAGIIALDGVYNRLDDPEGLTADCAAGRADGFNGKTLIHPNQIDIANRAFGPDEAELAEARALVAAATGGGGAERFEGRMIEDMHVAAARRLLAVYGAN